MTDILTALGKQLACEILRAASGLGADVLRTWLSEEQVVLLKKARRRERANVLRRKRARKRDLQRIRAKTAARRNVKPSSP